jgi:plastocyanin
MTRTTGGTLARVGAATLVTGTLLIAACDRAAVTEANTPTIAAVSAIRQADAKAAKSGDIPLVKFGMNDHGSPFDPAAGHDHSGQAKDLLIPRTVVIAAGGQVQFEIDPFHRVNVYRAGTAPDDIDVSKLINFVSGPVFIPNFVIDDATNRIAQSPPFQFAIDQTWTTPVGTFNTPGRYLVMCNFLPHFVANDMYGWVIVK